jgi:hypothetical protein
MLQTIIGLTSELVFFLASEVAPAGRRHGSLILLRRGRLRRGKPLRPGTASESRSGDGKRCPFHGLPLEILIDCLHRLNKPILNLIEHSDCCLSADLDREQKISDADDVVQRSGRGFQQFLAVSHGRPLPQTTSRPDIVGE